MAKLNIKSPNGSTKTIDLDKVLINSDITASSTNGSISVKGTNVSVYTHPTGNGNNHIPSNGGSNQILRYSAAGTAAWSNETTYSAASGGGLILSGNTFKITDGTIVQRASVAKGTNPSSIQYSEFIWSDNSTDSSQTHRFANMSRSIDANGTTQARLTVHEPASGSTKEASIYVSYPKGGTPYTYAPTPAAGDYSSKIATTAWVGAYGGVTACSKANNGYIKFKSGFMIQWGRVNEYSTSAQHVYYVTYPIAFSTKAIHVWGYDIDTSTPAKAMGLASFDWWINLDNTGKYKENNSKLKEGTTITCSASAGKSMIGWVAIGY